MKCLSGFGLKEAGPSDSFFVSEWNRQKRISLSYVVYRWTIWLFVFVNYLATFIDSRDYESVFSVFRFFSYLTSQGITLILIFFTVEAICVQRAFLIRGTIFQPSNEISTPTKIRWILGNVTVTLSILITLLYWTLLFHPGDKSTYFNCFVHGINSVLCLLDLMIVARPIRWQHFYHPFLYGLGYIIYSVIFYYSGATDKDGHHYIYDVLDWSEPGEAMTTVALASIAVTLAHFVTYLLYRFRTILGRHFGRGRRSNLPFDSVDSSSIYHINTAFERE